MRSQSPTYSLFILPLMLFALWQSGSCKSDSSKATMQEPKRVATGTWGGQDIGLNVTDTNAEVQFSCAHGTIDQTLKLDGQGRFSAKGTFTAETPGPVREDRLPKAQSALYEGRVEDQQMTLTVTIIETKERVGDFTLKRGSGGRVRKCL